MTRSLLFQAKQCFDRSLVLLLLAVPAPASAQAGKELPATATAKVREAEVPEKDYAQAYQESFRATGVRPDGWSLTSRAAEECLRFEQEGLRLTLPPGGPRQSAGIATDFGVKGDFEITLRFEILKDPEPADVGKGGTRLTLGITLDTPLVDTPKSEAATLNRSMSSRGLLTWVRTRDRLNPISHGFATPTSSGRLRLVRSGNDLFYLAAIAPGAPFQVLSKYRFGTEDVKRIAISGTTGSPTASFDARITDFQVRADAIPGAPDGAGGVAPASAATPRQPSGRAWWLAGLLSLLVIGAGLGLFLRRRSGRA